MFTYKLLSLPKAPLIPRAILFENPEKMYPQISPDGTQLAYCAPVNGVLNIWIKTLGENNDRSITQEITHGITNYRWSLDSKYILYEQDTNGDENYHIYGVNLENAVIKDYTPFTDTKAQILAQSKHKPSEVLITLNKDNPKLFDVYSLDLVSGSLTLVCKNPGDIVHWIANMALQVYAAVKTNTDGTQSLLVKDQQSGQWHYLLDVSFEDTLVDELSCGVLGISAEILKSLCLSATVHMMFVLLCVNQHS